MNWLAIVALVFQYGPQLIVGIKALVDAIREKNPTKGADAVSGAADLAKQIVVSLQGRSDLSNDQKREQAWEDLIAAMASQGTTLSETNARTLTQVQYQGVSGK